MTGWPGWSDAWAGPQDVTPAPSSLIERKASRGGSFTPVVRYAHRAGAWRPVERFRLPMAAPANEVTATMTAAFGFDAVMDGDPIVPVSKTMQSSFGFSATMTGHAESAAATTVINISDLLLAGETLDDPVDNTVHLNSCLARLARRSGVASTTAITTPHVTVDFEDRYIICERTLNFPASGDLFTANSVGTITGGIIGHACDRWPRGVKLRNGGIRQNTDDGFAGSSGNTPWDYKGTTTTADVTVPANTTTTFSVPVVTTTGSTVDFSDLGHVIRLGDKDTGTRVHWATKTATQFNGCTRMTASATSTLRPSGTTVFQNPYPCNRNRIAIIFKQVINRPTDDGKLLELENFWIHGSHDYNKPDYMLAREGQEAFQLTGQQWIRFVDCKVEETWADAFNVAWNQGVGYPGSNAHIDDAVFPGMIEILGGFIRRPGIMHLTANQFRCPDATFTRGFWRMTPDHINVPSADNDAPSASGTQYGIWWHGNAAHPFRSEDQVHSVIDLEPQGAYMHCCDLRVGADSDRNHFTFQNPTVGGGGPFLSAGNGTGLMFRHKFQHIKRTGPCDAGWAGSAAIGYRTATIKSTSNGVALPTGTIHLTGTNINDVNGGVVINVAGLGATFVKHTGRDVVGSDLDLTGCTAGTGTLATGATVRQAHENHRYFGANVAAGSNNVVIGAQGTLLGGTGFLYVMDEGPIGFGDFLFADWLRIWTVGGPFFVSYPNRDVDEANGRLTGVRCWDGQGATIKTGQAITWAMTNAERAHYTVGQVEVEDFVFTQAGGEIWTGSHIDGMKITKVSGPYRPVDGVPLNSNNDVINYDKGVGPAPYGDNGPFTAT